MREGSVKAANLVYGQGLWPVFIELGGICKTNEGLHRHQSLDPDVKALNVSI